MHDLVEKVLANIVQWVELDIVCLTDVKNKVSVRVDIICFQGTKILSSYLQKGSYRTIQKNWNVGGSLPVSLTQSLSLFP